MIGPFSYGWKALTAAGLLIGAWAWGFSHGQGSERAEWELRWAVRDANDLQAFALAEQQARQNEQAAQAAMDQVQADATKRIEGAEADAVGAGLAADRLREQVAKLLAAGRASGKAETCTGGPTAENPGNLLAVVLDKSVQRNRELAAFADSALIAAQVCQAAYEGR